MVRWRSRDSDIKSFFALNQTITSISLSPPSSLSYQLGYNLLSYRLGYNLPYISTNFFWSKSLTCLTKPRPSSLLDGRLARKDYLQISAFLDPVVVERGGSSRSMESHWRSHEWSGEKTAGRTRSGLTLGTSTSASTRPSLCGEGPLFCVVEARLPCMVETAEGLDVTLDNPAGLRRWILMDGWM